MGRRRTYPISRLRRARRAAWRAWCTPLVSIDEAEWARLVQIDVELDARLAEYRAHEAERLVLARTAALPDRDWTAVLGVDRLPLTADGDLHIEATTALVEVAVWGLRIDETHVSAH